MDSSSTSEIDIKMSSDLSLPEATVIPSSSDKIGKSNYDKHILYEQAPKSDMRAIPGNGLKKSNLINLPFQEIDKREVKLSARGTTKSNNSSPRTNTTIKDIVSDSIKSHQSIQEDIRPSHSIEGHASDHVLYHLDSLPITYDQYKSDLIVEDFEQVEHLTDGSNSNIYKAILNHKSVILKVMKDSIQVNEVALEEFEREVLIISRLKHSNILTIYGSGHVPSKLKNGLQRPLIALEPLTGGSLSFHIKAKRPFHSVPFTEARYLRIAKEFADALYYLHELVHPDCMLIHRDLKPDNIGFATDGTLKLMDFGLCIALKRNEHDHTGNYTLTGCTGSFRYMAPESALKQPYNEKVDMYSYGIMLYEIMTGCTPFSGIGKAKFYDQVVNCQTRPGMQYDDYGRAVTMSDTIKDFIKLCWDTQPSKRPSAKQAYGFFNKLEYDARKKMENQVCLSRCLGNMLVKKDTI